MTLTVSAAQVRAYLSLEAGNPTNSPSKSTEQIESNILAAQEVLERATGRWFVNRPATTYTATTMLRAIVPVPGFRAFTSVSAYGSALVVNQAVWPLPDAQNSGIYTALQFRAWRADHDVPWWLTLGGPTSNWFDTGADNPYDPRNYGGGWAWTSMPNDLSVVGDGGYAPGSEPFSWLLAVKQLAAFYTLQPAALLAATIVTPQGGVISYADLPDTVVNFINSWRTGQQAVSVG